MKHPNTVKIGMGNSYLISLVIPKCEEYEFDFLNFGDYETDGLEGLTEDEIESRRSCEESEGHLDAALHIWFKFEGYDKNRRPKLLFGDEWWKRRCALLP